MITHLRQHGRLSEERLDRYLPVLHNQLARLSIRVENLAETTRLQHSPLQLTPEWLNLVDLVRRSLQNLQSGRNDIVADLPQDVKDMGKVAKVGDPEAEVQHVTLGPDGKILRRVALRSAGRFEKPVWAEIGGPRMAQGFAVISSPRGRVDLVGRGSDNRVAHAFWIQVSDQGMSVARADLPHVFDRFYRAEQTTQTQRSVGMGLYVVRAIAQAHGGSVWADSPALGKGLTISVQLPCTPREAVLSHSHSQA